ncbi:hypothetical protein TFLX_02888 [Thermoflexales bacterium]|nr:hypothetical protein TFLX_02888 [Thermoflexales bacterium]
MTDQPPPGESSKSANPVSGGVNVNAEQINVGADVVGRDKVVGTYIEHYYAGSRETSSRPPVYHNLPQPDYGQFIGREAELAKVLRILRPYPHSQHALVTIDGVGGVGKSTLALAVAHRFLTDQDTLPREEQFEAIIWTSAKQTVLTADGIVKRRQVLRTLEDIFTTIAVTLQREDITRARPEEQNEVVRNALTRQRTLLIVDNLETVDDEAVMEFLRELPAPTKAIVTTRHRIDVAYPVRLLGMPWKDAQKLIEHECDKKSVIPLATEDARRLYERTGGVPLAIVWSIAQMGLGSTVEIVLRKLAEPINDIAKFCFDRAFEIMSRRLYAGEILRSLALFATDASRDALGVVADVKELDLDEALAGLDQLSLINKSGSRFSLLPLTRHFVLAHLAQEPETEARLRRRQVEYYTNLIQQHSWSASPYRQLINDELFNFGAVLNYLAERGEFLTVVDIFNGYYPFLWRQGHWTQAIDLALRVFAWAEVNKRVDVQARCNHWLGRLYLYQRQYAEAARRLILASQLYPTNEGQWISVRTYLAQVWLRQKRFEEAHQILNEALPIAIELKDNRGATRIHNALAEAALELGNLEIAAEHIRKGYELAEGRNDHTTVLGQNFYLHGLVEHRLRHDEVAREWVTKYKELADREGFVQESAQASLALAKIILEAGDESEARRCAAEARAVFERLGMNEELGFCVQLLSDS